MNRDKEPAGTTTLPNGAIRYDCCNETGGTPRIQPHENAYGELIGERYACPHCLADQGYRAITSGDGPNEASKRAFDTVGGVEP